MEEEKKMDDLFWNVFKLLVSATVVLLAFLISYYLLAAKKHFDASLAPSFKKIAQGFLLLLGVSAISILGGLMGALPIGRLDNLSMLMLPSLLWALLLLYQGSRRLVKEAEAGKRSRKGKN